ncbi:hypothetical protein D8B26_004164 [Coccidioides posadasii str. Silveira]|uniref:Uncharacterized protein n=1 Tax=Coccidioides posadasii (strain RMSCC 757 / Silveira) TaxID=443226 RepID=E9DJ61_COCPS|nr:conserved hypothetical protein [Coccidioides posadasii str. Silveira]QVM09504.1 hypothetical protein D8B26_004164 [Coccidioides posadasii str. Silveira]
MAYPIRSNKGDASVLKTSISVAPRILTSARRQESCRAENVKVETQQGTKQIIPSASILWVMILDPPIESLQVVLPNSRRLVNCIRKVRSVEVADVGEEINSIQATALNNTLHSCKEESRIQALKGIIAKHTYPKLPTHGHMSTIESATVRSGESRPANTWRPIATNATMRWSESDPE